MSEAEFMEWVAYFKLEAVAAQQSVDLAHNKSVVRRR